MSVLEHTFSPQPGNLQLCLSFHFLLPQGLTVSQRWELRAYSGLSEHTPWPWHVHGFLDSQKYVEVFQNSLPSFFSKAFQHVWCLPQLISFAPADSNWVICCHLTFKCFQQKYQSYFSAFWNSKKRELQVRWNEGKHLVLVLHEATQQVKTDSNSLRTRTALLPPAPETHTRNTNCHLQDCHWARKWGGCGKGKLKCHKALLLDFSHFFPWSSIHLVAVNLWLFSRVLLMLIRTVFLAFLSVSLEEWPLGLPTPQFSLPSLVL